MVRYWRRTRDRGWQRRAAVNAVGAVRDRARDADRDRDEVHGGRLGGDRRDPAAWSSAFYADAAPLPPRRPAAARRRERRRGGAARDEPGRALRRVDRRSRCARRSGTRDGSRATASARSPSPGRRTDPGLRARFRDLTNMRPDLEVLPAPRRTRRVGDRLPLGAAARRVAVRDRHRPRAVHAAVGRLGAAAPHRVQAQAAAAGRDGSGADERAGARRNAGESPPARAVCRILVSGAHAATMRAVHYARHARPRGHEGRVLRVRRRRARRACAAEWQKRAIPADLEIDEAPFRDIGEPLLRHLREITADPEAVAVVVMPELVFRGWRRLLHNQRALYVKRLLLFEPRVILVTVPYRLN